MNTFLALTGPTAVGKTELALELAETLNAEIISVDSRQVYHGMDVGTAKPTEDQLARVPHHFVSERRLGDPITAGEFAREASQRIADILARGRVPLAVGGSTLYLTALVHGLANLPPVSSAIAEAVDQEASTLSGRLALYNELAAGDPRAATTLDPSKSHRLARLVGVLRSGTVPSTAWDAASTPHHAFRVVVLNRQREVLYKRIGERVETMLAEGLIEENRHLLNQGRNADSPLLRTIGYKEPQAFLRGELSYTQMVERLKRNSRRYAKRQLTWFRRYPSYTWLDAEETSAGDMLAMLDSSA